MPTIINELIEHFNLSKSEVVSWGESINIEKEGVYIVSLSKDPKKNDGTIKDIPISREIIKNWIKKVDGFELDKEKTYDEKLIIKRLSQFWLSDENILYIGKTSLRKNNKGLGNRVNELYKTKYGEKRPHKGGHWIKSLLNLNKLNVHYIPCDNSGEIKIKFLEYFMDNVSDESKNNLRCKKLMLPFGNLELKKGCIKKHGLGKMT